jgi:hypothetical protein
VVAVDDQPKYVPSLMMALAGTIAAGQVEGLPSYQATRDGQGTEASALREGLAAGTLRY